jgi:hypothetical protein
MSLILDGTNGLSDVDGTAATPAIRGTDANTGIFFPAADTIAFSEGGVESMRIDSAGNVGIGTSSPATKLDVSGGNVRVSNDQRFTFGGDANGWSGNSSGNIVYAITNNAERMRIDSGGNFMVGTTTALGKFTVEGAGDVFCVNTPSAGGAGYRYYSGQTTGYAAFFSTAGGAVAGSIFVNGSNTSFITSSDYRLKENVQPMTGALAKVAALNPVTYTWKTNGSAGQGFIAHELQEVVPDCVTGAKDAIEIVDEVDAEGRRIGTKEVPRYQGVDTSFLVATLVAAIQEQQALITQLQADVAALKEIK